jgi:hypothetical protein
MSVYVANFECSEHYHQGYPAKAETERTWRICHAGIIMPQLVTTLGRNCSMHYSPHPEAGTGASPPIAAAALARTLLASATETGVLHLNYRRWSVQQLADIEFGSGHAPLHGDLPERIGAQPSFEHVPESCGPATARGARQRGRVSTGGGKRQQEHRRPGACCRAACKGTQAGDQPAPALPATHRDVLE